MIVILCGPPGSGKTTPAARLHRRLEEGGCAFDLLQFDWFDRRPYDAMYERVAGTDADWILDGTFYRREWRDRFRALDETYFVWVNVAREAALARNRDRRDPISEQGLHICTPYSNRRTPNSGSAPTKSRSTRRPTGWNRP